MIFLFLFLFVSSSLTTVLTLLPLVIKISRRDLSQYSRTRKSKVAPFGTSCQGITHHDELRIC